jgi:exodeoxyribonuclease VII small subunit
MPLSPKADLGAEPDTAEPRTFEAAYGELQHVVEQLENGRIDLERVVSLFERGNQLVQICERMVDQAELRVTRLAAETASPLADVASEP